MAKANEEKTTTVTVVARGQKGRYRAGRHFTFEPTTVDLTDAELKLVNDDPELVIVPNPAPAPADKSKA